MFFVSAPVTPRFDARCTGRLGAGDGFDSHALRPKETALEPQSAGSRGVGVRSRVGSDRVTTLTGRMLLSRQPRGTARPRPSRRSCPTRMRSLPSAPTPCARVHHRTASSTRRNAEEGESLPGSNPCRALWHLSLNVGSATKAGEGSPAAVVTMFVIVWSIFVSRGWRRRDEAGQRVEREGVAAQGGERDVLRGE